MVKYYKIDQKLSEHIKSSLRNVPANNVAVFACGKRKLVKAFELVTAELSDVNQNIDIY